MFKHGPLKLLSKFNPLKYNLRFKLFSTQTSTKPEPAQEKVVTIDTFSSFKEIDLRVGKVVEVEEMQGSDKLFICKIDLGEKELRDIGSGIRRFMKKESVKDKKVIIFSNLKPRKLAGFPSNGMILCAEKDNDLELLSLDDGHKVGEKVQLEGMPVIDPAVIIETLNDKKFKKYLPFFSVNNDFFCTFNKSIMLVGSTPLKVARLNNCKIS